ncbi:hypothetical protein ACHAWF_000408, partial [Thalassiosira exigua]
IVHRDLKPSNILISEEPLSVKISDFGLASALHLISIGDHSKIVGTMAYMSPEQTLGKSVDLRSDLYSFGVVLYELFYGKKPFYATNQMELLYTIHNKNVVFESNHEINRIIQKLLEKNPSDRYLSVKHVIDDLKTIF